MKEAPDPTTLEAQFRTEWQHLTGKPAHAALPVGAAVSGGGDSVALLALLLAIGLRPRVLHVNYGLRPEAAADEAFVRRLAGAYGLPFRVNAPEPAQWQQLQAAAGTQAAARHFRYRWFAQVAQELGLRWIATAHHRDDQLETLLADLLHPRVRSVFQGIAPRQGIIVRPLLQWGKASLQRYATEKGLSWREDRSNLQPVYQRNRIRLQLLPLLQELQPAIAAVLEAQHRLERAKDAFIAPHLERAAKAVFSGDEQQGSTPMEPPALRLRQWRAQPAEARPLLLLRWLAQLPGAGRTHWERLQHWLEAGPEAGERFSLPGGELVIARGLIRWRALQSKPQPMAPQPRIVRAVRLPPPGRTTRIQTPRGQLQITGRQNAALGFSPGWHALASDRLRLQPHRPRLYLRQGFPPGERLRLCGAPGRQPVKELLRAAGIRGAQKQDALFLCDSRGPVWAERLRTVHRVRLKKRTERVLLVRFTRGQAR